MYVPVRRSDEPVKLRFALFAVVFVGTHRLIGQPDTAPMLPHVAFVALYEEVANIIRQSIRRSGIIYVATLILDAGPAGPALS